MNKKEYKFLDLKLLELVDNNIISNEQYINAKCYYNGKRENKSIATIFSAIGIFLMALSIITLFAINWENISKEIKVIISFIPLIITSVMLYICISKETKKIKLYTSIFAPIAIIATNSLIAQVFHIQTEIYELIFTSLIMFLPIAFILRNYISIIVYGVGTILYSFVAINTSMSENIELLKIFILSVPLIIYNITNYINYREDSKNTVMWIVNVFLVTLFVFYKEIFTGNVLLIYLYTIYVITQTLFGMDNALNKVLSLLFKTYLIVSCISPFMVSYAEYIEFGFDTLFITLIMGIFIYLSKAYKYPKECFVLAFILLVQYTKMSADILFIFINIIAIVLGIYKIITGNQRNSYREIKQGISIILLLILFRFINADMSFMAKSIMFLIAGASFIIGSNVMEKRIGGKEDE